MTMRGDIVRLETTKTEALSPERSKVDPTWHDRPAARLHLSLSSWRRLTVHGSYRRNQHSAQDAMAFDILPIEPRWKREGWVERALIGLLLLGGVVQAALALS